MLALAVLAILVLWMALARRKKKMMIKSHPSLTDSQANSSPSIQRGECVVGGR